MIARYSVQYSETRRWVLDLEGGVHVGAQNWLGVPLWRYN